MDADQLANDMQADATITINYIFNSISIIFSSLIIITIITLRIKEINFSNRFSLHLIMYIAIIEVFFSVTQVMRIDSHHFPTWITFITSWGYIFSTLLICFLTVVTLVNLQLVIAYQDNYKDMIHSKNYYLIISFSLAIVLSVLPITFSQFKYNQNRAYFWYNSFIWEWMTYSGWIAFAILYCTISVIMMNHRLKKEKSQSPVLPATSLDQSNPFQKYVSRILLYSLVPLLSYTPSIISNLSYSYTDQDNFTLNLLSLIFVSSQSILTATIFFIFDPIVDEVVSEHTRNMRRKQSILQNIQQGVYVQNIYNVDSNNRGNGVRRSTIAVYNYAKKRFSYFASALGNERNVENNASNIGNDDNEVLNFL